MRIEDNNNATAALGQTAPAQAPNSTAKGGAVTPQSSDATDGLDLSNFTGSLSRIMQSDSVSRAQRVAQLAAAVQSGTYQVDPQAVSRAIVDHIVSVSPGA